MNPPTPPPLPNPSAYTCPNCGRGWDGDQPYCPYCGAAARTGAVDFWAALGNIIASIFLVFTALATGAVGACFAVFAPLSLIGNGGQEVGLFIMFAAMAAPFLGICYLCIRALLVRSRNRG